MKINQKIFTTGDRISNNISFDVIRNYLCAGATDKSNILTMLFGNKLTLISL